MSGDFVIYMVLVCSGLLMGAIAGFKLGYSYGRRVADGFSLTDWMKGLLPFGGMP